MSFKMGDRVFWESQAAGVRRRKEGVIVEVVDRRKKPQAKTTGGGKPGAGRSEESYIVRARAVGTARELTRLYWPRVKDLQPLRAKEEKSLEDITTELGAAQVAKAEDNEYEKNAVKAMTRSITEAEDEKILAELDSAALGERILEHGAPVVHAFVQEVLGEQRELPADGSFPTSHIIGVDMGKDDGAMVCVSISEVTNLTTGETQIVVNPHDLPPNTGAIGGEEAPAMTEERITKANEKNRLWELANPGVAGREEPK